MEIAIIIVFLALFGGAAFLAFLIWLIFRLVRKSSSNNRQFIGNSNPNSQNHGIIESETDETDFADNNFYNEAENSVSERTAYDAPASAEGYVPQTVNHDYSPPPAIYTESESSSSYDSGSSDSGSSDSGSSSSSD